MKWQDGYKKLVIYFDGYRKHWRAELAAPLIDKGDYWFKGTGPSPEEAFAKAEQNIKAGITITTVNKKVTVYRGKQITTDTSSINLDELEFKL